MQKKKTHDVQTDSNSIRLVEETFSGREIYIQHIDSFKKF